MTATSDTLERAKPAPSRRLWSYDQLVAELPETNQPTELWDGELLMAPAPFYGHQRIVFRLHKALDEWVERRGLGEVVGSPVDMVLSPHRVVQPDVAFVAQAHLGIIGDAIQGPADLVAEIISPGGRQRDRIEKKDLYEQYGVTEYWIVDPEAATVEVFSLGPRRQYELTGRYRPGEEARSQLLPGFAVNVVWLFGGKELQG
jgi:Uma2 family endonuclease